MLYGTPVGDDDARHLVATLASVGGSDALSAAASLTRALGGMVALTPNERDAILFALEDPPEGLAELRGVLARDHEQRHGQP